MTNSLTMEILDTDGVISVYLNQQLIAGPQAQKNSKVLANHEVDPATLLQSLPAVSALRAALL